MGKMCLEEFYGVTSGIYYHPPNYDFQKKFGSRPDCLIF